MRLFFMIAALWLATVLPANAQKTNPQIATEIATLFPDNVSGLITPAALRQVTLDLNDAASQWQIPALNIPVGRGSGGLGFTAIAPTSAGFCLVDNGPGVAPTFQACPSIFTGVIPNNTPIRARNALNNANLNIMSLTTSDNLLLGEQANFVTFPNKIIGGGCATDGSGVSIFATCRTVTTSGQSQRGYTANFTMDAAGTVNGNGYDESVSFIGTQSYGHHISYQAFPLFNTAGNIGQVTGFQYSPSMLRGTIPFMSAFAAPPPSISSPGVVSQYVGMAIGDIASVPQIVDPIAIVTYGAARTELRGKVEGYAAVSGATLWQTMALSNRGTGTTLITYTPAEVLGGFFIRTGGPFPGTFHDTMPSAASILDEPTNGPGRRGIMVGRAKLWTITNNTTQTLIMDPAGGTGFAGSNAINSNETATFIITVGNPGVGTEQVVFTRTNGL